jgi:peptidyl-prolyl cis-trans isomerase B (cyclophilin B)
VLALLLCVCLCSGCVPANAPEEQQVELIQLEAPKEGQDIAIFQTNYGEIRMMLFPDEAPQTVAHFKRLIEAGFYDGRDISQVDKNACIILTGEDSTTDTGGYLMTDDGKDVPLEWSANLWHFTGAVSAYEDVSGFNSKYTNSDSRFFIVGSRAVDEDTYQTMVDEEYPQEVCDAFLEYGGLVGYNGCFTVFAQVYEGLDVVDKIINEVPVEDDTVIPAEELYIISATLSTYTAE